jgi:hypothetical protein
VLSALIFLPFFATCLVYRQIGFVSAMKASSTIIHQCNIIIFPTAVEDSNFPSSMDLIPLCSHKAHLEVDLVIGREKLTSYND